MQRLAVDTLALCLDFLTFTEQLACRLLLRDVDAALATRIAERMVEQYFRSMPSKSIAEGCPLVLRHTRFSNEERLARFLTIVKARRPPNLDVLLRMAVANSVVASQCLAERRHLVASMPRTSRLADVFLSWLSDDPRHMSAEVDGFRAVLGRDALAIWTQAIGSAPSAVDARRDDDGSWMIDALEYFTAGSIIVYNHPALEAALGDVMLHFAPMEKLSNEVNVDPDVACVATQLRDLMPNEFAVTSRGSLNFEMPQDFFVAPPVEAEAEQPTFRISKKGRKIPLPPPPPPVDSMVTNWAAARMAQAVGVEANALSAVCAVVAAHHVVVSRNAPKALAHCSTARSMRSLGFAPGCESLTFADVVGHCDGLQFLDLRVATAPQAVHGTALHDLSDLIVLPPQECIHQSRDFSPHPLSFIDSLDRLGYASRRLESVDLRALDGCLTALGIACFSACRQLNFVALPDSVTTIGDEFCCDCPKLKTLMLPRGLQSVGNHFVCACNSLESVPSFAHCAELQYVGRKAFQGCRFLSYLILPESLTSIGAGFVDGCARLRAISIPPSLVALPEDFAFNCKLLSQVEFRDPHQSALVELQSRALCGCWALKDIRLPDSVRHLASCLNDCEQLVRIGLPASLQTVSGKVLRNCANLVEINWDHVLRTDGPVAALDVAACLCEGSNRAPSPPSNFMLRRTVGEQRRPIGTRLADLLEGDDDSPNSDDGSSTDE